MHARNKGSPKAIRGYKDELVIFFQLNLCDVWITDNRIFCELHTIGKLLTPLLSPACKREKNAACQRNQASPRQSRNLQIWTHGYTVMMHSLNLPHNACITTSISSSTCLETVSTDTACVHARAVSMPHHLQLFHIILMQLHMHKQYSMQGTTGRADSSQCLQYIDTG